MLPAAIRQEVEAHLAARIASADPVGGGCISPAARVQCTTGETYFLKWARDRQDRDSFEVEAYALERIGETRTLRVPRVIARAAAWLLLEWLPPGNAAEAGWADFGRALARLHRVQSDRFGWPHDNYIGSLPQANAWHSRWAEFWRTQRLEPQLGRARDAGHFSKSDARRFDTLLADLEDRLHLAEIEGASLLHGDLWSGNAHTLAVGSIAAIDPSSYYGHREVDLAMAQLFGGFPRAFFDAYSQEWPLAAELLTQRRAIYQLYYLLVHVNLFGASYARSCLNALTEARV